MIIASASQFHVYIFFQLGEGPSRGLLRDYEPSDGPPFSSSTHNPPFHRSPPTQISRLVFLLI